MRNNRSRRPMLSPKSVSISRRSTLEKKKVVNNITPEIAVSLLIHTASVDNFLNTKGIDSYFEALTDSLLKQKFKNFELIYIDTFYEVNKDKFNTIIKNIPYQVKHVEIHKDHRYWYDRGNTYISAAKNTGILYADGELCVTCDDAEFFPPQFLQLYWDEYKRNRLLIALHKRLKSIKTKDGKIVFPISGDEYVNDTRFDYLKNKEYKVHNIGTITFAGTSFGLKDALLLNGFNEKMDGCKSLEDCDFGVRLSLIGKSFSLFKEGFLYILEHPSYSNQVQSIYSPNNLNINKNIKNFIAIENYSMIQCARKLMDIKANKLNISEKHIQIIKEETLKYREFDPTDSAHIDNFNIWLNCPNFDLEEQRKELRASEKWIWKK